MHQNTIPNRKKAPLNKTVEELILQNPQHTKMKNGMDLFILESGLENVARIDIVIGAGSSFQSQKLCASFTNHLLKEGTKEYSSTEIAEKLDFYGAYLSTSISKDKSVITLFSLTKHLSFLLPMLKSIVTDAVFNEEEFNVHLNRNKQEFLINSEKARYIASYEFNKIMFGEGTAYGQTLEIEDFDNIKIDDLKTFYKSHYQPNNTYLIVSGRLDSESKHMVNKLFGEEWNDNKTEIKLSNSVISTYSPINKTVVKDKFLQSAIRIGKNVISKVDEDYSKLLFTNIILGGFFGSRLMSNLREDKGLTYGINSFMSNFLHGSYFAIATEVNIKHSALAIEEIKKEINILQNEIPDEKEIKLVKNYIYGNFLKNFDGPFALAEMFRSVNDFGLSFDFYHQNLNKIMNISPKDVMLTAQKHFDLKDMSILVIGNNQ
jgi:predicted Zn-dependent peptidase